MGKVTISMRDHTNEKTTFICPSVDLTAVNIDTEYSNAILLQTALAGVSRGNIVSRNHIAKTSPQGIPGPSDDEEAQREEKAMLIYANEVTFVEGRFEVPVIDMTLQMDGHPGVFYLKEYASDAEVEWQLFVGEVETMLSAAQGGDSVVVLRAYHIGKAT
jgi:hypothetical protein